MRPSVYHSHLVPSFQHETVIPVLDGRTRPRERASDFEGSRGTSPTPTLTSTGTLNYPFFRTVLDRTNKFLLHTQPPNAIKKKHKNRDRGVKKRVSSFFTIDLTQTDGETS